MKYAAFFRGINVGGKHRVNMADLRQMLAALGLQNVRSTIQSGNVVFESQQTREGLPGLIAERFAERFGFQSTVILRSADEIDALLSALPFPAEELAQAEAADPKTTHVYVFLSDTAVSPALSSGTPGGDRLVAKGRELYLLCYQSILKTKCAAPLLKPDAAFTSRNLRTLRRMQTMLRQGTEAP